MQRRHMRISRCYSNAHDWHYCMEKMAGSAESHVHVVCGNAVIVVRAVIRSLVRYVECAL